MTAPDNLDEPMFMKGGCCVPGRVDSKHLIHTSDRNTFKACRQKWDFCSPLRQSLEPIRTDNNLFFGTAMHGALEVYYNPATWGTDVLDLALARFEELFPFQGDKDNASDVALAEWRTYVDLGLGMMEHYAKWASIVDQFLKPLYAEIKFEIPIGSLKCECGATIHYAGKIDLIIEDEHGGIWIIDHKTAASLDDTEWLAFDEQISSYCWAISQMLGIKVEGFIYNELVKTVPHPPKVLKKGELSQDKRQNTTFELYLQTIKENDLRVGDYVDFLRFLRTQDNKFFRRTQVSRSPRELMLLGNRIAVEAKEMTRHDLLIYPTPSKFNCKFCAFKSPCLATLDGSDFSPFMDEIYKVREER